MSIQKIGVVINDQLMIFDREKVFDLWPEGLTRTKVKKELIDGGRIIDDGGNAGGMDNDFGGG